MAQHEAGLAQHVLLQTDGSLSILKRIIGVVAVAARGRECRQRSSMVEAPWHYARVGGVPAEPARAIGEPTAACRADRVPDHLEGGIEGRLFFQTLSQLVRRHHEDGAGGHQPRAYALSLCRSCLCSLDSPHCAQLMPFGSNGSGTVPPCWARFVPVARSGTPASSHAVVARPDSGASPGPGP